MGKNRKRRYAEARQLKRTPSESLLDDLAEPGEPCVECGAEDGEAHKFWCESTLDDDELDPAAAADDDG